MPLMDCLPIIRLSNSFSKQLFFTGTSQASLRLKLLFQHGYLARPERQERAMLPFMVYWLDIKGATYVAGLSGYTLSEFRYRAQPKWLTILHDIAVNDVRISVIQSCQRTKSLELEEWISEADFVRLADRIEYSNC
jgi:hypothetical protein